MKTYLSIDLDYWNWWQDTSCSQNPILQPLITSQKALDNLIAFLKKAKEVSQGNIQLVDSHEELKKYVNRSNCTHLINVDYHNDIWDRFNPVNIREKNDYNCGTWVNFIKKSCRQLYTWIYPHDKGFEFRGYCSHTVDPFCNKELAGWKEAKKIFTFNPEDHIPWSEIEQVGIAVSYDWVETSFNHCLTNKTWQDIVYKEVENIFGFVPKPNPKARL